MKVSPTRDWDYIHSVLTDPEIWSRIAEDDQDPSDVDMAKFREWTFLQCEAECGPVGMFALHRHNGSTIWLHAHILAQYRKEHTAAAGREMMRWMHENLFGRVNKIIAEIPVCFGDVYGFARKHGFTDEGISREAFLKGGEFIDVWRLGITRGELREWVEKGEPDGRSG